MSPLRQKMLDALVLRGMAEKTQQSYVDDVSHLARYSEVRHEAPQVIDSAGADPFTRHYSRLICRSWLGFWTRSALSTTACSRSIVDTPLTGVPASIVMV